MDIEKNDMAQTKMAKIEMTQVHFQAELGD
jgi:hypothetical protein